MRTREEEGLVIGEVTSKELRVLTIDVCNLHEKEINTVSTPKEEN